MSFSARDPELESEQTNFSSCLAKNIMVSWSLFLMKMRTTNYKFSDAKSIGLRPVRTNVKLNALKSAVYKPGFNPYEHEYIWTKWKSNYVHLNY